jgi:hypothetical protein
MLSSGMLGCVVFVRADVSEERSAVIITGSSGPVFFRSLRRLLVMANVPSSPILVTLMMKALNSSETSGITRATRRNIPEDVTHHSHCTENLNLT